MSSGDCILELPESVIGTADLIDVNVSLEHRVMQIGDRMDGLTTFHRSAPDGWIGKQKRPDLMPRLEFMGA